MGALTADPAWRRVVAGAPAAAGARRSRPPSGQPRRSGWTPADAVVFGSGPAWAAALEAALLLKEVSGMPAEGVETREGATSTMMALGPAISR